MNGDGVEFRAGAVALAVGLLLGLAALGGVARANHGLLQHISLGEPKDTADAAIFAAASLDGSRVFFATTGSLVSADADTASDIYERSGGATTFISRGQINGNGAFGASFQGVSADGSLVFFTTDEQLVSADTDAVRDIYERSGGTTTRISAGQINGNGAFDATFRRVTADGSRVFFESGERLVSADTDNSQDVYQRSAGTTTLVSAGQINGNGAFGAFFQGVSEDGSRVLLRTGERLVAADTDNSQDIYQRSAGTTTLISAGQINGNGAFDASTAGASDDGSRVFFSTAEPLVAGDTDTRRDVYERAGGTTTRISVGQINGNGAFDADFGSLGVSADGSRIFFTTDEQLVSTDSDTRRDVYERSGGTTTLITVGEINGNGAFHAGLNRVSDDGARVFFATTEPLVPADTDTLSDVYERSGGTTTLVTVGEISGPVPSDAFLQDATADLSHAFFETAERLVPGDTDNVVDVYERSGGTTRRVSTGQINGNGALAADYAGASADGSRVFTNTQEQLTSADGDTASGSFGGFDVYERSDDVTTLLSVGEPRGNGGGEFVDAAFRGASADGSRVFFATAEKLVSADTDNSQDIYQRSAGTTTRISSGQVNGNGAFGPTFSGASNDGTRVFFSTSEQLVTADTDTSSDVYERSGTTTSRVSAGQVNGNGAFAATFRGASNDGTRVFFSTAEPLVAADTDTSTDVYQRSGGTTTRISAGQVNANGAFAATFRGASNDGSLVFFSTAEPLVAADTDTSTDVYQRSGNTTSLVSAGQINGNGAFGTTFSAASNDGSRIFFRTAEPLVAADTDTRQDIYQRSGGATERISAGQINGNGAFDASFVGASDDGGRLFFSTLEPLIKNDSDTSRDVYERSAGVTTRASTGQVNGNGAFDATFVGASTNGDRVFIRTREDLVASDTDSAFDLYQRSGGTTTRVSAGQLNGNGAFDAFFEGASADGSRVFFETDEGLVSADTDASLDIYERIGGATRLISPGTAARDVSDSIGTSADGAAVFFSTTESLLGSDTDNVRDVYGAFDTP